MNLFIGLMSGTSMDGIDAVLVEFGDSACRVIHTHTTPYEINLASALRAAATHPAATNLDAMAALDIRVAHAFAEAALELISSAGISAGDVDAAGSHGQTVLHRPDADYPFSLQLGDPATLARLTDLTIVADFRNGDIALGGQGAPLVPAFHDWAFRDAGESRAVVNIGGIANVTRLDVAKETTGFDTGPGNGLLDAWCREQRNTDFDADGAWAATGAVNDALLTELLADPYFARAAPKSTGTDHFNLDWLRERLRDVEPAPHPADVQATLSELTASTVAAAVGTADTVAVCGGGAFNSDLMRRLAGRLQPRKVLLTSAWGVDPEWVEAVAFAWLARQRLRGEASNVPSVTGASGEISLGGIYLPPTE